MSSEAITPEMTLSPEAARQVETRTGQLLAAQQLENWRHTDRLFAGLLAIEWVAGIIWAVVRAPWSWEGSVRSVHPHVWQAIFLGLLIVAPPIFLAFIRPGAAFTRHMIAASQMLTSALLIHISGGRVETHFHVFGSLAFVAFYRDWRVLATATVVVAADHLFRNLYLPESVFGVIYASPWRWLEHAVWVVFEDIVLLAACHRGLFEMRGIAHQRALLEHSYEIVEEKVRQRTSELHSAQDELMKVARSAGMAEIATSVLHNVGNVLNSVNVSLHVTTAKVQQSPVGDLSRAIGMMNDHKEDLGQYITQDQRGRLIPGFLEAVAETLNAEQKQMLEEMGSLAKNVEHIKEIIGVQQSHAKAANVFQMVRLPDLLEDALKVAFVTSDKNPITIERQIGNCPSLPVDKHAVLQILINLMSNARHAIIGTGRPDKKLVVRCATRELNGDQWVRIEVIDNGVGIDAANLTRVFSHGFTTKKDGHGFGLHASANSAKQMGGSLSAHSDGPGRGTAFILDLPVKSEPVPA